MAQAVAKPRVRVGTDGRVRGAYVDGELVRPSRPSSAYMRAGQSPFFFNWNPALRDQRDEVRQSYIAAAARTIDAIHNSGWLAGAVDQSIASTIGGSGLRLSAAPDRQALGITQGEAEKLAETIERRFIAYAESAIDCDAAGKQTLSQMSDSVLRANYSHGEALALFPYIKRPFGREGTKVQLLPPHRMSQNSSSLARKYQGVSVDRYGLPISYEISLRDELLRAGNFGGYVEVRARDAAGRPQVAHIFEGREGQMRGITPLAPALLIVRQYDQLSNGTLQAALLQTIFAATVTSEAPTDEILRALQSPDEQGPDGSIDDYVGARGAWYENTKIDLGGMGRIAHLFPGDSLEFKGSQHPNGNYEQFAKFLLREVARCLGMTFETLTGDYSGATYSSVRMATSEIWPIILRRRQNISARFMQMVYEAWLEEEIERGVIKFPGGFYGFLANRTAAVQANWRGPAKPQADDLKTAKAHEVYVNLKIMSRGRVADDLGYDWGDEVEEIAREESRADELGVDLTPPDEDPLADKLAAQPDKPAKEPADANG